MIFSVNLVDKDLKVTEIFNIYPFWSDLEVVISYGLKKNVFLKYNIFLRHIREYTHDYNIIKTNYIS